MVSQKGKGGQKAPEAATAASVALEFADASAPGRILSRGSNCYDQNYASVGGQKVTLKRGQRSAPAEG